MNKIETLPRREDKDIYLSDFIKTISPYKWSILFVTLIVLLLTSIYLYFTVPTYESSATIKIKTDKGLNKTTSKDLIHDALSESDTSSIEQEIAILKSFYINKKVIEKLNMQILYFKKDGYKKNDLFNSPIEIQNITIEDSNINKKEFILHPEKNGFKIEQNNKVSQLFQYNQEINLKDFKCTIKKKSDFFFPIYFKLNGSSRDIYENIVKQRLKVSQLNIDVSIIKISYQDTSIKRANTYINELINTYLEQRVKSKNRKNKKVLNFINQQLETTGERLHKSEMALQEYKVKNKVIEPTKQSKLLLERLNNIEIEIEENRLKESLIKKLLRLLKSNQNLGNMIPILKDLNEQPTIELIQKIENMKQNIDKLRIDFTDRYPEIVLLRNQIKKSQNKVYGNIKNIRLNIEQRIKNLNQQKMENEIKLKKLPKEEKNLIQLQRNYDVNAKIYSYLLEKKSENDLKRVATLSDYEVIDSAYSSNKPIKPKKAMLLIASGIIGLMLGVFIAYIRNRLSKKVQTIRDIQKLTTLPLYGEIPIDSKKDTVWEVLEHPNSILTAYFRKLRTTLQLLTNKTKGNSILITSSMPKEGKIEIILNLTYLFQLAGYKSIVIDLDLYQPTLHNYFNIKSNKGVSTYLNGKDNIEDITFKTKHPHPDIILAGEDILNPSELLLSQKLRVFFSTLEKNYDYIFINASPLMVSEETLYLMQFTDINLIVIKENFTKKSFVTNLNKILKEYRFKNIRLLFNTKNRGKDSDLLY